MSKVRFLRQPDATLKAIDVTFGGVKVEITEDGNVNITGAKNLAFDAEKISFHASESLDMNVNGDIYIGSSTHIITQAPRHDGNPDKGRKTGYKVSDKIKKMIRALENYYPSWRDYESN